MQSESIATLAKALNKAQSEISGAKKSKNNPQFKSKYADLSAVWEACRGVLSENGLSVIQLPCEAPAGHVGMLTILLHNSGEFVSEKFSIPVRDASNPQAAGSAITYARRYALSSCLGICPEDDDGNAATVSQARPQAQPLNNTVRPAVMHTNKAGWLSLYSSAKTLAEKKSVFTDCRNSDCPEPGKSEALREMSADIKKG